MKPLNAPGLVLLDYHRPEWASCAVPYRPWWRQEWATHLDRRDGKQVRTGTKRYAEIVAACEEFDAENPLPFPGIRAGQIWSLMYPQVTFVIGPLSNLSIEGKLPYDVFYNAVSAIRRAQSHDFNPPVEGVGHPVGLALLFDPCRPDLVPWNGACPL